MEPPAKRPRTGPSSLGQPSKEDEDDELNYEPDEVSRMRDPGYQLEQSRAFAAFKLKSTFEHIFQKYERDFTGIGDEIDLRTGKIITDNGHLARMRNERDTGIPDEDDGEDEGMLLEDAFASGDNDDDDDDEEEAPGQSGEGEDEEDQEDAERMLLGKKDATTPSTAVTHKAKVDLQPRSSLPHTLPTPRSGSEQRPSNLGPPRQSENGNPSSSANPWGREPESADPTWRVPEIKPPTSGDDLIAKLYGARYRFPVSSGSQSVWASRQDSEQEKAASEPARIDMAQLARARQEASRMARPTSKKLLQAFTIDDDKEDDILGVSTADREPRIEKKKEEKKNKKQKSREDAAKDQTQTEPPLPGSSAKEYGRLKTRKSSAEEKSTPKKQLVPAKVRKPRKTVPSTEAPDQGGEEHLVDTTTRLGSTQGSSGISTDKAAQTRPRQHIVIEIFSKRPAAHEIAEVEGPEDMDIFDSAEQDTVAALKLDGLTVSEPPSKSTVTRGAYVEAVPDAVASVEVTSGKTPAPPKERFTRHEIDPAYTFSDDDDGIPTTRARAGRSQKEYTATPVAEESTKRVFARGMRPSERMLLSDTAGDRQDTEAQPETEAENGNPLSIVDESANPSFHGHEVSQAATEVQSASSSQLAGNISDERQTTEPHITNEINMAGAEPAQPTDDVDMRILELLDEIYQETESYGRTQEGAQEGTQLEKIREEDQASDVPVNHVLEETRTYDIQGGDETREKRPAGDILQERDKGVIEPFIIPLGLDEMDETSAAEAGPEPEAMDVDLPMLPPLAEAPPLTGSLSAMPRRGRQSSAIHSGRLGHSATSPMRGFNLQSSSPLERHAARSPSPAEARRSAQPGASASPKRETTPQTQTAVAGWPPPAPASQSPRPEAADAPESPADSHRPSPASRPHRRKRQPKQPSTPSAWRPRITTKGSSARKSVISLLSDDDDDDDKLTLDLFKTRTPGGGGDGGDKRSSGAPLGRGSSTPALPAGPQSDTATPVKQHVLSGSRADSGASSARHLKRRAAWALATPSKTHLGSPSGSLVRTPGGNTRRCGEGGFRCDREFCFTCL